MQLSNYVKIYPVDESPGQWLLYSTRNAAKILLKEEILKSIENGGLSPSDEALLSELGMIVQDKEEEKRAVLGFIDGINAKNSVLNITVVSEPGLQLRLPLLL